MKLKINAPLDPGYMPMALVLREFEKGAGAYNTKIVIAVERNGSYVSTYKMNVYPDGTGHDDENFSVVERVVKTLLWARGGYKITIAGSKEIGRRIADAYAVGGERDFDRAFMARVYERDFEVEVVPYEDAPKENENAAPVGRHLDGCRIGFDAGGSDRKVSAVIDGKSVYSEEVVWFPKTNSDPSYHYNGILEAMKSAASHMPRVDAIGVSSAGVYIDNKIMVVISVFSIDSVKGLELFTFPFFSLSKQIGGSGRFSISRTPAYFSIKFANKSAKPLNSSFFLLSKKVYLPSFAVTICICS